MRIVIFSDGADTKGGSELVAVTSAVELARRGHEVDFVAAIGPISPELQSHTNLRVHCLNQSAVEDSANRFDSLRIQMWNPAAHKLVAKILDGADPKQTILHAHTYLRMLSVSGLVYGLEHGFKLVATLHDYGLVCPNRLLYHHREARECNRTPMGFSCCTTDCTGRGFARKGAMLLRSAIQAHRGRIAERASRLLCVSDRSRSLLSAHLPDGLKLGLLRNPIQVAKLERAPAENNKGFLFIGRLTEEKDPVAFALAAKQAGVDATFIGDGPLREALRQANPEAKLLGWLPHSEVQAHVRHARALVFPSRWYEASPLVIQEAMANGIPVVCSNASAATEYVFDDVNGAVFEAGSVESLVAKLKQLSENEVHGLSQRAYQMFWAGGWDMETHGNRLVDLYQEVLEIPVLSPPVDLRTTGTDA